MRQMLGMGAAIVIGAAATAQAILRGIGLAPVPAPPGRAPRKPASRRPSTPLFPLRTAAPPRPFLPVRLPAHRPVFRHGR